MLDPGASGEGRGAYICPNFDCFNRALKKKALERQLRAAADFAALRRDFENLIAALAKDGKEKNIRNSKRV